MRLKTEAYLSTYIISPDLCKPTSLQDLIPKIRHLYLLLRKFNLN